MVAAPKRWGVEVEPVAAEGFKRAAYALVRHAPAGLVGPDAAILARQSSLEAAAHHASSGRCRDGERYLRPIGARSEKLTIGAVAFVVRRATGIEIIAPVMAVEPEPP